MTSLLAKDQEYLSNDNSESVHFKIRDSDLSQFYKTNCGQLFASKALSINNIHFQVYIYPNGDKKEQFGYIQFMVELTQFESNIKSITIRYKLYCVSLQMMFKDIKTLHKMNDIMRWCPHQLQIPQRRDPKPLDFVCEIEILRTKSKSSRKLSLQSMRKDNSLSISSMDISVFEAHVRSPLIKSNINIEWSISNKMVQLFMNVTNGSSYYTQNINNMWCLCLFPNGMKQKDSGNAFLLLKLMLLPPEIRSIEVDVNVEIQSKQLQRRKVLFNYDKTQESFKLFATPYLKTIKNTFKLKVMIKIINIYQDVGNVKIGREITDSWSVFAFDQFKPGIFECYDIDYGQYDISNVLPLRSISWTSADVAENTLIVYDDEEERFIDSDKSFQLYKGSRRESTLSNSWLTLPLTSSSRLSSNSITSLPRASVSSSPNVELSNIKEDVQLHYSNTPKQSNVKLELWSENSTKYKGDVCNAVVGDTKKHSNCIFLDKFKQWLCDDVQKGEYLQLFESNGCADIRLIKHFGDNTLSNIGIINTWHRKLILDEVTAFKTAQQNLNALLQKHSVFASKKQILKKNGIFTISDLENIANEEKLQEILQIPSNDSRVTEIWDIIHPSQCTLLQTEMNELKEEHKVIMDGMEAFVQSMMKMQHKISAAKPNAQTRDIRDIEQQQDAIFNKYHARLIHHQIILQRGYTSHSESGFAGLSLNGRALSPSKSQGNNDESSLNLLPPNPDTMNRDLSDTINTCNSSAYNTTSSSQIVFDHSHLNSQSQDMEMIKDDNINISNNNSVSNPTDKVHQTE